MMRTILLVLAVLVFGAVAWAAFMLLPAHQQIRDVVMAIPTAAEVDAALLDADGQEPVEIRYLDTATQAGPGITISHTVAVLRWADGRTFLIDTGMNRQAAQEFSKTIELVFGADEVQTFGPVEEQMGEAVQSVRGIGFTHLHIDHTSGVTDLCAALDVPAVIYQTHQQATLQNLHTEQGRERVEGSACDRRVLGGQTIAPVPGFPGLAAIAAGGHTPGSNGLEPWQGAR